MGQEVTLNEIVRELKDGEFVTNFIRKDQKAHYVGVYDQDVHLIRLFVQTKSGKFKELDANSILDEIADYLKDKVNVKAFLRDVVSTKIEEDIMDLFARIHGKKPKVKEKKGCYSLEIYGKRGKPFVLSLNER